MGGATREFRWDQLRQLMRLVGEASELPVEGGIRRQHALAGLAGILGSPAAVVVVADPRNHVCIQACSSGVCETMVDVAMTGFDAVTRPAFEIMMQTGCTFNPAIRGIWDAIKQSPAGTQHVAAEQDLISRRAWSESEYVVDFLRPAGLDHVIIPARELAPTGVGHFAGFFRARRDRSFDERDRNLLELFVLEHSALLWPDSPEPDLSPRLREMLAHLLAGESAKEIASSVGLSLHTVNEYIAALYRKLGVRSRGELFVVARRWRARPSTP